MIRHRILIWHRMVIWHRMAMRYCIAMQHHIFTRQHSIICPSIGFRFNVQSEHTLPVLHAKHNMAWSAAEIFVIFIFFAIVLQIFTDTSYILHLQFVSPALYDLANEPLFTVMGSAKASLWRRGEAPPIRALCNYTARALHNTQCSRSLL